MSELVEQTTPSRAERPGSSRARAIVIGGFVVALAILGYFLLRTDPNDSQQNRSALRAGLQAHREGRTDEARAQYLEVLKSDPSNKFASFNLGVIEQRANRLETSETYYRQSLASDPSFQPALFNLAVVREAAGANDEAADLYRRLLQINPDHATGHLNFGFLLTRKLGQQQEGRAELEKAVDLDPKLAAHVPRE